MELAKQQSAGGKSAEIRVTQEKKEQNEGVNSAKIDNLKPDKHFFGADLVKEPLMKSKIE